MALRSPTQPTEATSDDVAVARLLMVARHVVIVFAWVTALLPRLTVGRPAERTAERKRAEPILAPRRCRMVCPHGDRCTLEDGHEDGCNHRVCPCNEPNRPLDASGFVGLVLVAAAVGAAHLAVGCSGAAMPLVTVPVAVHCQRYDLGGGGEGEGAAAVETTSGGEVGEDGEVMHALDDTYDDAGTTTRIVYRTPNAPAPGFVAGWYVGFSIGFDPANTTLNDRPTIISCDILSRNTINLGN